MALTRGGRGRAKNYWEGVATGTRRMWIGKSLLGGKSVWLGDEGSEESRAKRKKGALLDQKKPRKTKIRDERENKEGLKEEGS